MTLNPIVGRLAAACAILAFAAPAGAAVTLTAPTYGENFNSLAASGPSSSVPAGWEFSESGANANTTYTAGTGSSNAGDTYSFGTAATPADRAFGTLRSGNLIPLIGVVFTNGLGASITDLVIGYNGEQYRLGTADRADRLDFQYSLNATSISTGTWTDFNALDFIGPDTTAPTGITFATTALAGTIGGLNIANGATFALRWQDFEADGADDGLAVDDFTLTARTAVTGAVPEPASWAMMIAGFSLVGGTLRARKPRATAFT